jgi:NADH-quinone oxidoreductase subunit E
MLTQEEISDIEAGIAVVPDPRAAAPHALGVVQQRRRWISDETLKDIADYLKMSTAELDAIATFYNRIYRSPVGKHVILLCDSVSCWIMGYESLLSYLLTKLGISSFGQTSKDGVFTLLPSACLGACDHAPALMIDDELFGDLTVQRIDEILARFGSDESQQNSSLGSAGL